MLLTLLALTAAAQGGVVRHALIVGVNDGGGTLDPLLYAEQDAQKMAEVLTELGDFDESRITVLYRPDQATLQYALAKHAAISAQHDEDLFLFYYSGHADARGLRLQDEVYPYQALKHDIRNIDAEARVGVLDACRSGTITRLKGAALSAPLFAGEPLAAEGEAWLTASSADEMAQESDSLRGGFFTHYLVSGLRGAADTGDGSVDLEEAMRYASTRVVEHTSTTVGGAQHPHFDMNLKGSGSLVLTSLAEADAAITLPAELTGDISIFRNPARTQVVAATKLAGQPLQIALPAGAYTIRRRTGDKLYEVGFGLHSGARLEVDRWGEVDMERVAWRGVDNVPTGLGATIEASVEASKTYIKKLNLDHSPVVAGGLSLLTPGVGQFYNRQYVKGGIYLGSTALLMTGTVVNGENFTGDPADHYPSPFVAMGLMMWGAAVADAIYNVDRNEDRRPITGVTISPGVSYGTSDLRPYSYGLSADLVLTRGLSLGLDNIGYTARKDGTWDVHVGTRAMAAIEWGKFRPGLFVAFGLRTGQSEASYDTIEEWTDTEITDLTTSTRLAVGVGANFRYYVVPRYFFEVEGRWDNDGGVNSAVIGIGAGIHLGR